MGHIAQTFVTFKGTSYRTWPSPKTLSTMLSHFVSQKGRTFFAWFHEVRVCLKIGVITPVSLQPPPPPQKKKKKKTFNPPPPKRKHTKTKTFNPPPQKKKKSSGDIPNSMRCSFSARTTRSPRRTSWNPGGTLVEPWWNPGGTVVEPWWNPGGTLVEPCLGPPRTTPEPIWAETPKLSAVGEKNKLHPPPPAPQTKNKTTNQFPQTFAMRPGLQRHWTSPLKIPTFDASKATAKRQGEMTSGRSAWPVSSPDVSIDLIATGG